MSIVNQGVREVVAAAKDRVQYLLDALGPTALLETQKRMGPLRLRLVCTSDRIEKSGSDCQIIIQELTQLGLEVSFHSCPSRCMSVLWLDKIQSLAAFDLSVFRREPTIKLIPLNTQHVGSYVQRMLQELLATFPLMREVRDFLHFYPIRFLAIFQNEYNTEEVHGDIAGIITHLNQEGFECQVLERAGPERSVYCFKDIYITNITPAFDYFEWDNWPNPYQIIWAGHY